MEDSTQYDFIIIGSGLGGLECGYILSSEGYKVCVVEKNRQLGGSLQVFSRNKRIFDTGVHYIGSLDKGQNLYQFFKYFGIMDHVDFKKLDINGFDQFIFKGDPKIYLYGQGYQNFQRILTEQFPDEEQAINSYCAKMQEIVKEFPLYNVKDDLDPNYYDKEYLSIPVSEYIDSLSSNKKLKNVLAGSLMLYAGVKDETPLYVHALVVNSYIQSAYRCEGGGSKIAVYLAKKIRHFGGKVLVNSEVVSSEFNDKNEMANVILKDGTKLKANKFISNIAPKQIIKITGEDKFKKAFVNRINKLKTTLSSFSVHVSLKENYLPYKNYNTYYFRENDVWDSTNFNIKTWPSNILLSMPYHKKKGSFTNSISLVTYMTLDEVKPWIHTKNIDLKNNRGEDYNTWKKNKEQELIKILDSELIPGISEQIEFVESSTPLTYRDYIGNNHGAMYGTAKDYKSPLKSFINTRTKVPNLFLTGQYLNLHGVLGVTVSAFLTCFEFIDRKELIKKVKDANKN